MRPDQQHGEAERSVDVLRTMQRSHNSARLTAEEHPRSEALYDHAADTKLAMDAVTEYIAANDELIAARKAPMGSPVDWMVRMDKAFERHAAAHARMKGETK